MIIVPIPGCRLKRKPAGRQADPEGVLKDTAALQSLLYLTAILFPSPVILLVRGDMREQMNSQGQFHQFE